MTDTIRIIVKRTKAATETDQALNVDLPRINGCLDSIESVCLEGYRVTGSVGAVPADVVVELTGAGADLSTFVSHVLTDGTRLRSQEGYLPVFPPGGAATFDRTNLEFVYKPRRKSNMDLSGRIVLSQFDAASGRYIPWTDWTDAMFVLKVTGFITDRTRTLYA